jgi:hypothetical protein
MATRARSGGTGMAVALVIFGVLFVIGIITTMIFHNKWQESINGKAVAEKELNKYATNNDRKNKDVKSLVDRVKEEDEYTSVVGLLMSEHEDLRSLIHESVKTVDAAKGYKLSAGVAAGKSMHAEIETLRANRKTLDSEIEGLKEQIVAVKAEVETLKDEKREVDAKYRTEVAAQDTQIKGIGADSTAFQASANATIATLEQGQQDAAAKHAKQIEDLENLLLTKEQESRDKDNEINRLKIKHNPAGPNIDPALEVDGKILSVIRQDNLVTINRGERDRLLIGLTFEVFDVKKGVTRDQFGDVRGKATVEVVKIKEYTTECRIVRTERGQTIQDNDLVANVVYDKNRIYKFYVFGDFDIANDGRSTPSDARRIKGMITQWGGRVASEMSYDVDFLVLGLRPEVNVKSAEDGDFKTPEQIEADAAREKKMNQYLQLEGEARTFRIPILNQNRFLGLVGHYNR